MLKAFVIKAKDFHKKHKKVAKSYIAVFLILMLGITSTFAWFTNLNSARVDSNVFEFQSSSSLRINKDKTSSNKITIPAFTLDEASSLDGRNIYFPVGATFNHQKTSEMFFREGNTGDRNVHYVYKDFELKGTSGNTPIYIKSYEIKVQAATPTDHNPEVNATYHDQLSINYDDEGKPLSQDFTPNECPIRLAFIADSGVQPVVIDPSAQVINSVDNTSGAVSLVDENGVPTTTASYPNANWNSFSSYYYGNTPLFVIPGGQTLNVTLVVWLEGTLPDTDKYIGKQLSIDIEIESNFADMDTIQFYDDSQPDNSNTGYHWVSNDNPIVACSYEDPFSDESPKRWKTVIMKKVLDPIDSSKETYTWTAKIPKKAVTNISFYRISNANGDANHDQATIYNAWHTTSSIETWITASTINNDWYRSGKQDLQTTRRLHDDSTGTDYNALVYTAVHGNGYSTTTDPAERLAPCVGYWDYSGGSGGSTQPGGGDQHGGGSQSTYDVGVVVDNVKTWVQQNIASGSKMHFTTSSGGDYVFDNISGNHLEQHFNLKYDDEITGFYVKHLDNSRSNLSVNQIFKVSRNVNVVFKQESNDSLTPNLTT